MFLISCASEVHTYMNICSCSHIFFKTGRIRRTRRRRGRRRRTWRREASEVIRTEQEERIGEKMIYMNETPSSFMKSYSDTLSIVWVFVVC